MMMIKLASFLALALGVVANQSGGSLRGLKSTDENIVTTGMGVVALEEPSSLADMDKLNYPIAVEVFGPSNLQDEGNENERDLSSYCYDYYDGAIRTSNHHDAKGTEGTHYHLYKNKPESWCKSTCSSYSWCKAYEYYHHDNRCELWKQWYGYFKYENGFKSYVKKHC
jgi:hypothetical protein